MGAMLPRKAATAGTRTSGTALADVTGPVAEDSQISLIGWVWYRTIAIRMVEYIKLSNHRHQVGDHFELSSLQSILALFDFGKFHIITVF
jgi:hypothetical protein